jgi:predicted permease
MGKLRALWLRLRGLFGSERADREFAAELESHLVMDIEDGVRSGLSREEARRQAMIRLGGLEQARQAYRDLSTVPFFENLLHDTRYGLRMIARNPGFAAVAIISLAVGIGPTATAFNWIDAVLLRPLGGVAHPEQLATLVSLTPNGEYVTNSYPDYVDFRDHLKLLEGIAMYRPVAFSVGKEDHAERVWGEFVSGDFFAVLGVKAELGRVFAPEEYGDKPGAYPVMVISDRYWRSHLGADPHIVGRTIRVNQHELTVAGIAPPEFHGSTGAEAFDLWVPYMERSVLSSVEPWMLHNRQDRALLGIARLKQGVTLEQARQELAALAQRMAIADADTNEGMSATLLPLWKSPYGPQGLLAGPLRILMGVCILLLAIVCVNVANLLLARATVREKEFSTRLALGAGRWRLAQQVLIESLLLTGTGAVLGIFTMRWMGRTLQLLMPPGQLALSLDSGLNLRALAFTAGLCLLTTLAAGVIPAWQSGRASLNSKLSEGGGRSGAAGRRPHRLRSWLVVSEVALALVALVCAGLFIRGFEQTRRIDPGFDPDHVLLSQFYLATNGLDLKQRKEFCRRLREKMEAVPDTMAVAYSDGVPLGFEPSWWEDLQIEGFAPAAGENMKIFRNVISPGYLELLKIPLVEGRNFTEHDDEKSRPVMIVNETFARRFFAGRDPIGRRVHGWGEWFTVVGLARDSKYHYLGESAVPYFYVPFRQIYRADMNLAFYVRTSHNPMTMLPALRSSVREINPDVTVFDAVPLAGFVEASLYSQKVAASLLMVLGGLSMLLAGIGLYSVMAYSIAQRTREIGIRIALGARPADVLAMVVGQGMLLAGAGLVLGAALALIVTRGLAELSFTNSAMGNGSKLLSGSAADPLIYAAAASFLCAVAGVAAYVPARRAASIEPMEALRIE